MTSSLAMANMRVGGGVAMAYIRGRITEAGRVIGAVCGREGRDWRMV